MSHEIDVFVYRPGLFVNENPSLSLDSDESRRKRYVYQRPNKRISHLSILSAPFPTRQLTGESIMMQSSSKYRRYWRIYAYQAIFK